ncbi:MAG: hypothetical protein HY966_07530 [Ignavibacteriales bacterium]|nr:hypothetical protein [Ignavibacteriales bacterium]
MSNANDTLAVVGSACITTQDLFERISLMPFEEKLQDRSFESVKRKAVESLVGEKLLASVQSTSPAIDEWREQITATVLRKLFVKDALYKREISSRVQVADEEIREGMRRSAVRRKLLVVRPRLPSDAQRVAVALRQLRSKGMLLDEALNDPGIEHDSIYIGFGSLEQTLEDAAYALKDSNDVSSPIVSQIFGTVVIVLVQDEPSRDAGGKSMQEQRQAVTRVIRERKERILAEAYTKRLFRRKRMDADTALFRGVAKRMWEVIVSDSAQRRVPKGYRYLPDDVYRIESEFREHLHEPLARGSFGKLSLGEFLENLLHYDLAFPSVRPSLFASSFFHLLRTIVEADMIAEEGIRSGFANTADVRKDVATWSDYWKARNNEFSVVDTATYRMWEPLWSLWREQKTLVESSYVASVQEILLPDSAAAERCMQQIKAGASMDSLAFRFSLRDEWRRQGGVSGWIAFKDYYSIVAQTLMMDVGELKGPLKLAEGYSVLKLLDWQFRISKNVFDSLRDRERRRIRQRHQQSTINKYVAHIAMRERVEIYYDKIARAEVANLNMFTRRLIGFGGRMNAAPILMPQWQWVDEWKRLKNLLP